MFKLCYVDGYDNQLELYFTNNFEHQWGDDWDDSPYEHNAGEPYDHYFEDDIEYPIEIKKIYVERGPKTSLYSPCYRYDNSPYSVEQINHRITPWVRISDDTGECYIFAGESYNTVMKKLDKYNCNVYVRRKRK